MLPTTEPPGVPHLMTLSCPLCLQCCLSHPDFSWLTLTLKTGPSWYRLPRLAGDGVSCSWSYVSQGQQSRAGRQITSLLCSSVSPSVRWAGVEDLTIRRDSWFEGRLASGRAPKRHVSSLWGREASRRTNTKGEPGTVVLSASTEHCAYCVQGAAPGPLHTLSLFNPCNSSGRLTIPILHIRKLRHREIR